MDKANRAAAGGERAVGSHSGGYVSLPAVGNVCVQEWCLKLLWVCVLAWGAAPVKHTRVRHCDPRL